MEERGRAENLKTGKGFFGDVFQFPSPVVFRQGSNVVFIHPGNLACGKIEFFGLKVFVRLGT